MTEQTDHELIELAAKAYGEIPIPLVWIRPFDNELTPINNRGEPWNPLNDDGDALRLAVKLRIEPHFVGDSVHAVVLQGSGIGEWETVLADVPEAGDLLSATRRAIVRAAAAIGETMP